MPHPPVPPPATPTSIGGSLLPLADMRKLADELAMDFVDLDGFAANRKLIACFPAPALFRYKALPIERTARGAVRLAICDPYDLECLNELSVASGERLIGVLAEPRQIEAQLHTVLGLAGGTISDLVQQSHSTDISPGHHESDAEDDKEASVLRLVNELLSEALEQGASDIHIEPGARGLDIRFRVDGQLRLQPVPDELRQFQSAIVSRLKIMAQLNIAEKRLPQDGRIELSLAGREVDVRVSVIPVLHGESIVMRLLDQSRASIDLEQMQFPGNVLQNWRKHIRRPNGMILVTGPTGSGKTTTLYASLAEIRQSCNKIITIEDPVEYQLDGISQIQVRNKIGLSFAEGLRSVLRHDPDAVLIGEIRDSETALSAVQAALTGHLVFSTLHTNDAASALTRLTDMGIEPYLAASTLQAVLAQRLVRKLCTQCRVPLSSQAELPSDFSLSATDTLFTSHGCPQCHGTGFSGRLAIVELLEVNNEIRRLCSQDADSQRIRAAAIRGGMTSLRHSGWQLVATGQTTFDEVLRVTVDDESIETEGDH